MCSNMNAAQKQTGNTNYLLCTGCDVTALTNRTVDNLGLLLGGVVLASVELNDTVRLMPG